LNGVYFDSAYLVKCYLSDPDSEKVRRLFIRTGSVSSSSLCLAEVACAAHRAIREKSITQSQAAEIRLAFASHLRAGIIALIPVSDAILQAVQLFVTTLPSSIFLRSGDAVHLASARHEGFSEIWSNDRHMLKAAPHFGITGRSV
jgi:predicted nucleic acid-binding protein